MVNQGGCVYWCIRVTGPGSAGRLGALAGVEGSGPVAALVQAGPPVLLGLPWLDGVQVQPGHELDALLQALEPLLGGGPHTHTHTRQEHSSEKLFN